MPQDLVICPAVANRCGAAIRCASLHPKRMLKTSLRNATTLESTRRGWQKRISASWLGVTETKDCVPFWVMRPRARTATLRLQGARQCLSRPRRIKTRNQHRQRGARMVTTQGAVTCSYPLRRSSAARTVTLRPPTSGWRRIRGWTIYHQIGLGTATTPKSVACLSAIRSQAAPSFPTVTRLADNQIFWPRRIRPQMLHHHRGASAAANPAKILSDCASNGRNTTSDFRNLRRSNGRLRPQRSWPSSQTSTKTTQWTSTTGSTRRCRACPGGGNPPQVQAVTGSSSRASRPRRSRMSPRPKQVMQSDRERPPRPQSRMSPPPSQPTRTWKTGSRLLRTGR
mmetsp:Transcript_35557/g.79739  ORF Transcript_35557/g.79739 Transcript_35557/m.79739 type:complete len:340 (+) Transcript_35557:1334-2353(+)